MSSIHPVARLTQQMFLGRAVRQNHALEHATIVLLAQKFPEARLSGISFATGFFVFGELPTEAIRPAAEEALRLLRSSDPDLAIHERCGTNLAVSSLLTGAAVMAVARMRRPYNTFNNVVMAAMASIVISRPLGLLVQRYLTTQTPNETMVIEGVKSLDLLGRPAHFVQTDNPGAAGFI